MTKNKDTNDDISNTKKPVFFLVGGAVRDQMLGVAIQDRDWVVVGATPEQMINAGFKPVGKDFPVFLHPETGEEYALARTERKSGTGHQGFTFYYSPEVTLAEDLQRRDLTINALAMDQHGKCIDTTGGLKDLKARQLRHISDAFREDPLRVLRVARFRARLAPFGFAIAPQTLQLMREITQSGELGTLSCERVTQEMTAALTTSQPALFFETLIRIGALAQLMPTLNAHLEEDTAHSALAALSLAAKANANTAERFAALTAGLYREQRLEPLCMTLRLPKAWCALATLCGELTTSLPNLTVCLPEPLLALLEKVDAFRRKPRFESALNAARFVFKAWGNTQPAQASNGVLTKIEKAITVLNQALSAAMAIDTQSVIQACMAGNQTQNRADIGQAVRQARLTAISQAIALLQD